MGAALERGQLLYAQKRYKMAADEFRNELSSQPNNALAMSMLGLSLTYDGQSDAGIAASRAAIALAPALAFAQYALACAIIGPAPRFGVSILNRARLIAYRRRLRRAMPAALEAIRLGPRNADFLALLAAIEFGLGHPKQSLKWAEEGLACRPDHVRCATTRAMALGKLGDAKSANQSLRAALALDPENAHAHASGGWANLHAGDARQATEHFKQALRLNPNDDRSKRGLHVAHLRRNLSWLDIVIILSMLIGPMVLGVSAAAAWDIGQYSIPLSIAVPLILLFWYVRRGMK